MKYIGYVLVTSNCFPVEENEPGYIDYRETRFGTKLTVVGLEEASPKALKFYPAEGYREEDFARKLTSSFKPIKKKFWPQELEDDVNSGYRARMNVYDLDDNEYWYGHLVKDLKKEMHEHHHRYDNMRKSRTKNSLRRRIRKEMPQRPIQKFDKLCKIKCIGYAYFSSAKSLHEFPDIGYMAYDPERDSWLVQYRTPKLKIHFSCDKGREKVLALIPNSGYSEEDLLNKIVSYPEKVKPQDWPKSIKANLIQNKRYRSRVYEIIEDGNWRNAYTYGSHEPITASQRLFDLREEMGFAEEKDWMYVYFYNQDRSYQK